MPTEPLTPTPENDLRVADAVGMEAWLQPIGDYPYTDKVCRVNCNGKHRVFSPTTCWDDALKALGCCCKHLSAHEYGKLVDDALAAVGEDFKSGGDGKCPLVICEAILAVTEKGGE